MNFFNLYLAEGLILIDTYSIASFCQSLCETTKSLSIKSIVLSRHHQSLMGNPGNKPRSGFIILYELANSNSTYFISKTLRNVGASLESVCHGDIGCRPVGSQIECIVAKQWSFEGIHSKAGNMQRKFGSSRNWHKRPANDDEIYQRSGHFDEQDMTNWEKMATADRTYANATAYFLKKYKEKIM